MAVGFDFADIRKVRRWMCKYCGFYEGPEGKGMMVAPNLSKHYWDFKGDTAPTPKEIIAAHLKSIWPWSG